MRENTQTAEHSLQAAGRLGLRCGVPPRQTQTDNIVSSNPRLVEENPSTASGPPPLRRAAYVPTGAIVGAAL